jgi:peptide/nickel transport system substrate-binding protein
MTETPATIGRRTALALATAALAVPAMPSAAQPGPPTGRKGQIIAGIWQEPTVFHPLMPGIEVDQGFWMSVFSALWDVDPKGAMIPMLAAEVPSVENGGISADGLAWKVKLRDGVTWHDGAPFTAEDVKFTLELINAPGFRARTRQGHNLVRDIKVEGPLAISWRMEKAFAPYVALLGDTYMVPKHILEKAADPNNSPFNAAPVGTGAFKLAERVPGDHITLEANDKYFGAGPYVERLIMKYIPDTNAFYTQFRTGQVDVALLGGILSNNYAEVSKLPGRKAHLVTTGSLEVLMPNLEHPALADKAVRQALYMGLNKQAIIDVIYYGIMKPTESVTPQESWAYNPGLPKHVHDPARANKMLDEAGWVRGARGIRSKNGVPLEFNVSTTTGNALREQTQQLMQQDWQALGVSMKISNMAPAVIWGEFYVRSKFQMLMVGTAFRTGPDPDPSTRFSGDSIPVKGGSGGNYMQYANPAVDKLLAEGDATFDQAKRRDVYFKLQEILRDELPVLPMFQYVNIDGVKDGLVGFQPNSNARLNLWHANEWYWAR